ncbi:hypothetical protein [Burkholderia anthina]|uniref:hypothetical protein n=1 Tax=Burkholderia anthina TaxID=179879 RepID=UPI00158A390F
MFANRVDVRLKLKAAATFAQGGVMATVAADNSRIDFNIDANGLALVGVKASGKSITGDVSGANIVGAPAAVGGGYQSVLLVTGDHCRIGVHGENLTYGTADNTSVPRVLSTGPVVGGKITRCTGKNVIAGFVNQAGDVSIDYLHMYKCGNNGIYDISAGGNVTIDTAIFEGDLGLNLQTVVSESLVTIDNLIVRDVYGYAAVDKAGSVIIGNYSIITTTPGKTHQVMVSRDGATSVSVRINTVSGNLWLPSQDSGGGIFQFFKGVPNQIEIGRIALDLYYQDGATKQLWVQTDGSQCVAAIDDIRLRLIDQSGKLTSSDIISMQLPTFGLASYINQIALSSATATISVSNVMQANLKPPAISELTQGNGAINSNVTGTTPRIFYMSGVPTGGTYRTGDVVKIKFPTLGKPSEYTCMGGGSPGTWTATAGTVKRGNTANRPTGLGFADAGWMYIDDQLNPNGKPIFWSGTAWIDSAGNAA